MEQNVAVGMLPSSSESKKLVVGKEKDTLVRKSPPSMAGFQPSSKVRKLLNTSKPIEVDSDPNKSIVSYETNVNTSTGVSCKVDLKRHSFAMDHALKIQANLPSEFPSFVKTMLLAHVASGYTMNLPKKFTDLHLPKHDETVVLVDESDQEYKTKYLARKNGLSGGWRRFSIAHKLQEKDVLVFHLIQQYKFKIYIVRANALSKIDGAIVGLLNLGAGAREMDNENQEKHPKITQMAQGKHLERYSPGHSVPEKEMVAWSNDVDPAADQYGMESYNCGSEDFVEIRFSQSVVDFKDVKCFEDFNILVDGMIIDCEIPQHVRVKYYELCCSQESYLHDQLLGGLNLQLVIGFICETINIADAIRSSKSTACCENLKIWDMTLKAFEDLGMKVGFLRARIKKLLTLSSDLEGAMKDKILEKVKAEEELKALSIKLSSTKEVIEKLESEIDVMKVKGERLQAFFMEEAKAPW